MNPTENIALPAPGPLRIVTACKSVVEFIHRFYRMVDERNMVVALQQPRPQGATLEFSVHLANGKPMFQGKGRVVSLKDRGPNPGLVATIELGALDEESRTMHRCLLIAAKVAGTGTMGPVPPPARPSPPPPPPRQSFLRLSLPLPPPPVEPRRLPESEMRVPANPLGEITSDVLDQFIESAITDPSPPRRSGSMPLVTASVAGSSTMVPLAPLIPVPPPAVAAPPKLRPEPESPWSVAPHLWADLVTRRNLIAIVILMAALILLALLL